MKNWFETLNAALEAEHLSEHWNCLWSPLSYNQTARFYYIEGERLRGATIYRNERGQYERPIHYDCGAASRNGSAAGTISYNRYV